jgi:hypothetical protein
MLCLLIDGDNFVLVQVRQMFYHAFDGYMEHAFPLDELRPLSCTGENTLGGYALTLVRLNAVTLAWFSIKKLL